jgi:hypothetical protein
LSNTTSNHNTAGGFHALFSNTEGSENTAIGSGALSSNTGGNENTATGANALFHNIGGVANTAIGFQALLNTTTGLNTAVGTSALINDTTGDSNVALGIGAGNAVTTGNNVICIGANVAGANINDSCFIGNIYGQTAGFGTTVYVNSSGQLGTMNCSQRFKDNIKPMDKASEVLFALKPVTFRYKKKFDPKGIPQFGLVAEDVEKVNPDLVVRDADGKVRTVRYEQINAMLLNEFLKEHKEVEQQQATIADLRSTVSRQEKQIAALGSGLQKVSAQVEMGRLGPQAIASDR